MKNGQRIGYSDQYIVTTVTDLNTGASSTESSNQRFASTTRELFNVVSNNGDGKTPLAQSYMLNFQNNLSGTEHVWFKFGATRIDQTVTGGTPISPWSEPLPAPSLAYEQALGKLSEEIRGAADWLTTVAQGKQTLAMVAKMVKIVRYVNRFPKSALKESFEAFNNYRTFTGSVKVRETLRQGGAMWLQYSYGLKPLAQDVYDSVNELAFGKRTESRRFEAKAKDVREFHLQPEYAPNVRWNAHGYTSARVIFNVVMKRSETANQLASQYSAVNPVGLAWELMPFSFIVDWAYDIGGYIANMETAMVHGARFQSGFVTTTCRSEAYSSISGGSITATSGSSTNLDGGARILQSKDRSILFSYPLPFPPVFRVRLGSGRMLNAAALLAAQFSASGHRGRGFV